MGADHGGGKSRYLVKTNYLSSEVRCMSGNIEFGSRLIQFAEIKCRKDTADVQELVSPRLNKMICSIEGSKMIGVIKVNDLKSTKVFLIPSKSKNIRTSTSGNMFHLSWENEAGNYFSQPLNVEYSETLCIIPLLFAT